MTIKNNFDLSKLLKAQNTFERVRAYFEKNQNDEIAQMAAVQAFEFCFELSWKILKRVLASRSIFKEGSREIIRASALSGFNSDPELWFDFLKKRNLTSHVYEEVVLEEVVNCLQDFSEALKKLTEKLGQEE